jgi:hypothetical protein
MTERVEHRILGDLVEHDTLNVDALERLSALQDLAHVPGDGLALAIRVGGEVEVAGALQRLGDLGDVLFGARVDLPGHVEVVVRAHRAVLGRQVADMAVARQHLVVAAEVLVDRFRLRGRFNDDDVHGLRLVS